MSPARARFFLELAVAKEAEVQRQIRTAILEAEKTKLLGSIGIAMESGNLSLADIVKRLSGVETFPLGRELTFADGTTEQRISSASIDELLDRPILLGNTLDIDGLDFVNHAGGQMRIRTGREYRAATAAGYYPLTTFAIKMAGQFSAVDAILEAVEHARPAAMSYVTEPYFGVADLHLLPPSLLIHIAPEEDRTVPTARSLLEMATNGELRVLRVSSRSVWFEWAVRTGLSELLRADLDGDGLEEILIQQYVHAIGGTLGFGAIGLLRRTGPDTMFTYEPWSPRGLR